jgi:GPI mannosyltransferase 3
MIAEGRVVIHPKAWRRACLMWCVLALAVRVQQIVCEPAYLHPDALFQALEPAFRLVWGHGAIAWEFREGVRSWAWPGLLAGPMALCKVLGLASVGSGWGMAPAIAATRLLVAMIDVVTVVLAARLAWRRGGIAVAWASALVLALHPVFAVTGAQPLIEVPATAALVWACEHAFGGSVLSRGRALRLGIALALTAMLRIQLLPALVVIACALVVATRRQQLTWEAGARQRLLLAALAVMLAFGALDWVSWGAPFHSLRAYLAFNLGDASERFGVMPIDRYWRDLGLALPGLGIAVLAFALVAARRHAWLLAVVVAVVLPHQLVAQRQWRFLHPALPLLIVLAALGAAVILSGLAQRGRLGAARWLGLALALAVAAATVLAWVRGAPWETTWLFDRGGWAAVQRARGLDRAMLALSSRSAPSLLVQAVLPGPGAPGAALLGHDVPVAHTVGAPQDAEQLAAADAWIVGPEQETPAELTVVMVDPDSGVQLVVR